MCDSDLSEQEQMQKFPANPKPLSEVKIYTGKKRGKYKKHSDNEDNKTNEDCSI